MERKPCVLASDRSKLPVAEPTGFTMVVLTALACKIAPICLIPYVGILAGMRSKEILAR